MSMTSPTLAGLILLMLVTLLSSSKIVMWKLADKEKWKVDNCYIPLPNAFTVVIGGFIEVLLVPIFDKDIEKLSGLLHSVK